MSITITDSALIEQLRRINGDVELKDPSGSVLGRFVADNRFKLPPGVKSPFTEEQLQELRKQRGGRPLADILRDLEKRA